jgi:hypothetical protein
MAKQKQPSPPEILIAYWNTASPPTSTPAPSREKILITFTYFLRYLTLEKIKEAIEITGFARRTNAFAYMCGILHAWIKEQGNKSE